MKIHLGSDHAGFELKEKLVVFLRGLGHDVSDHGARALDENDDYPDFVIPVAKAVVKDSGSRGVILGGSGQGEAMAANRVSGARPATGGARAAVYYGGPLEIVKLARKHNNANILSLGARFLSEDEAKEAVRLFLETDFSGDERHIRRIEKIDSIEFSKP